MIYIARIHEYSSGNFIPQLWPRVKKTAAMSRRRRPSQEDGFIQEDGDHVKKTALFKKTSTVDFARV